MGQTTQKQGWHIGEWGLWGWLETAVKGVGILIGFIAFAGAADSITVAAHPHLVALIMVGLLTLGYFGAIFIRIFQRELVSIAFSIFNALGHLALLIAFLRQPDQTTLPILFGLVFVAGELVKQRFLTVSGYTELGQTRRSMRLMAGLVIVFYVVFVILLVV